MAYARARARARASEPEPETDPQPQPEPEPGARGRLDVRGMPRRGAPPPQPAVPPASLWPRLPFSPPPIHYHRALVCLPQIDEEDCAGIVYQKMARRQPVIV